VAFQEILLCSLEIGCRIDGIPHNVSRFAFSQSAACAEQLSSSFLPLQSVYDENFFMSLASTVK
jgi:hypothetical protein